MLWEQLLSNKLCNCLSCEFGKESGETCGFTISNRRRVGKAPMGFRDLYKNVFLKNKKEISGGFWRLPAFFL